MSSSQAGRGRPTIRTVAEHAGVSKSLVSLVLSGSPHVSDDKRQRVLDAIETLGYRRNASARSLSRGRTGAVGVLLNDLRSPWFADCIAGLNMVLHDNDMTMLLGDARLDQRADERLVRTFVEMQVDGLVLVGSMEPLPSVVEAAQLIPTVVAGGRDIVLPSVDISAQDDYFGAQLAVNHLIELGHRNIAHVTGTFEEAARIRLAAYRDTMVRAGLEEFCRVESVELTEPGGRVAAKKLLAQAHPPTAIFVAADIAAIGAISAAHELGLVVPVDVSIVGYDNAYISSLQPISLTTVDVASEVVGQRAARMVLERIASPGAESQTVLAIPELVIRGTTAPPGRSGG